ncbi:MAG: RagB/SusD family nutrient uptake outer membrane protein, partial [Sphingobacteriales bacterium]
VAELVEATGANMLGHSLFRSLHASRDGAVDIRRWRIAENVLNGWAHGAKFGPPGVDNGYIRANLRSFNKDRAYLWPVPQDERALNPNLGQNPGW